PIRNSPRTSYTDCVHGFTRKEKRRNHRDTENTEKRKKKGKRSRVCLLAGASATQALLALFCSVFSVSLWFKLFSSCRVDPCTQSVCAARGEFFYFNSFSRKLRKRTSSGSVLLPTPWTCRAMKPDLSTLSFRSAAGTPLSQVLIESPLHSM